MARLSWVACGSVVVALTTVPFAGSAGSVERLVRPGVGIGKARLGMSIKQTREALGRPLVFQPGYVTAYVKARIGTSRYLTYATPDDLWSVTFLGPKGKEKLVRIGTESRRERLRNGIGVGTPVSTLPDRLRGLTSSCVGGEVWLGPASHQVVPLNCAITTDGALTIFFGTGECAVPLVRYQGCPGEVRVPVAGITVESATLSRLGLSVWDASPGP